MPPSNSKMSFENLLLFPSARRDGSQPLPLDQPSATMAIVPVITKASIPAQGQSYPTYSPPCPKTKRKWNKHEDERLKSLFEELGHGAWAAMARHMPNRSGKQVRERWLHHLSPGVSKKAWTVTEDNVILEQRKKIGNSWSIIAAMLQGRSDNAVKNRYYTTLRRRVNKL